MFKKDNSSAHCVKENFSTVLQLISREIHWARLPLAVRSSHLYSGITALVERDASCPGKMGQARRFQTSQWPFGCQLVCW